MPGRVRIDDTDKARKVVVIPDDGSEEIAYPVSRRFDLRVREGDRVEVGQQLIDGCCSTRTRLLRIQGATAVQLAPRRAGCRRSTAHRGVSIHDKHIEIIVRQMPATGDVLENGDTDLLPGEHRRRGRFEAENRRSWETGGQPASLAPVLMGITKASLATESCCRSLLPGDHPGAHRRGDQRPLRQPSRGLKENVIIASSSRPGTGISRYRNIRVSSPTEEGAAAAYSLQGYDDADWAASVRSAPHPAQAVPLDDYDYRSSDFADPPV